MGLFDNMATPVEDIQTSFRLPANTYKFVISDVKMFEFNNEEKPESFGQSAVIIELTVVEGDHTGKTYSQWLRVPDQNLQEERMVTMYGSMMKKNLMDFGVPEDKLNKFNPEKHGEMLIGSELTATVKPNKKNPDYDNLYNITLTEESGVSDTSVTPSQSEDDVSTDDWA